MGTGKEYARKTEGGKKESKLFLQRIYENRLKPKFSLSNILIPDEPILKHLLTKNYINLYY